jgi:methyl-accepting chemotaxis protein
MKLTVGKKLGVGFGTILTLMAVGSALSYLKLADIRKTEERILKVRVPTIEACKQLQTHLQYSNSKARQGILAGEEASRRAAAVKAFETAWDSIEKDVAALQELAPQWTFQENRDGLTKIRDGLASVREGQQAMMDAAASGARGAVIKAGND